MKKPPETDRHAEDGQLVRRAQAGDEEALALIYHNNVQAIYRYVYNRVGDAATAEDLTSEVFVQAVEALPRYRHRGAPLAAWLYRIARDRVIDYRRAAGRRPTVELNEAVLDLAHEPEGMLIRRAEAGRLRRALERLTPDQRDVLFFRFSERLNIQQTASMMGKTVGAVKALQFRALQALARILR